MKKALITLMILAFTVPAYAADPGDWAYMGMENVGISFGMIGLAALDADTFVAATLLQSDVMVLGLKSTDGGNTIFEVLRGSDVTGLPIMVAAAAFDSNNVLMAGLQMTTITGGVWRSTHGGDQGSWEEVDLTGMMSFGSSIDYLECVTDTFGVALISPIKILATYDAGASWTALPSPISGSDVMLNGSSFLDENIGYVATGYDDSDTAKSLADDPAELALHRTRLRTSPVYRWQWEEKQRDSEKAILTEGIYKTMDGGQTWETLIDRMNWYASRIDMASEQYGVVVTEEEYGDHGNERIRYTDDGGKTWNTATAPESVPDAAYANYIISDIYMINNDLGYAAVMYGAGSIPIGGGMFITTDKGRTWDWEQYHDEGLGYMDMDMVGRTAGFAGGMSLSRARYEGVDDNTQPVADAGEDQEAMVMDTVALDGSGSVDPENDSLGFKWTLTDAPEGVVEIVYSDEHPYGETKTFMPDVEGDYTFELKVDDGQYSDTDEVIITVTQGSADDDADDDAADDVSDDDSADSDDDGVAAADDDDEDSEATGGCGC